MSPAPSLCDLLIQRYNLTNFVPMLSLWDFFAQFFSSTRRSLYARSLRKDIAHLSSMSRSIWHLIQWSMKNGAGGVANQSFVRANSNYNTRMYIS